LNLNPMSCDPEELKNTVVDMTVMNGIIVYSRID